MIQTEKAILAAVILENSLVPILLANADRSLFSHADNQIVFDEIEKLHQEGQFFDVVILADRLSAKIQNQFTYLSSVMECVTHSNIKFLLGDLKLYLNTLKRERARKELTAEMNQLTNEGIFDLEEAKRILSEADSIETETESGSIEDCFEELDKISDENKGITLGFPTLDQAIGGLRHGEVLLFMARTGVGKTFWVLNVLSYLIAHTQERIALFSLEMPKISMLERFAQIVFSISREEALDKLKTDEETKAHLINSSENLMIYTQNYSVEEVELKIKEVGSKIVFIDYLDLLKEQSSRYQNRYERVSNLIIELKRIAKRQESLLIILHQLQRQAEEGGVPVKLTMARDSGVIEEASDFILGGWRPELAYDDETRVPEDMKNRLFIKLLKNKRGLTQTISCFFEKNTGRIRETGWNRVIGKMYEKQ